MYDGIFAGLADRSYYFSKTTVLWAKSQIRQTIAEKITPVNVPVYVSKMRALKSAWKWLTDTNALKLASGKNELYFFESMYRVIYLAGLSTCDRSIGYLIYSVILKSSLCLIVIGELWQIFSVPWTLNVVIDSVNVLFIQFGALYKHKIMMSNKDVFKKLSSAMESKNFDLSTSQRRKLVDVWQKRNEGSIRLLLGLGTCTLIAWHVYPLVDDIYYNLMVNVKLPFKYETPTSYALTYIGILLAFSYTSYFVMTNDLILQAYLMHLLCQFSVLNDCFRNILKDCKTNLKVTVDPKKMYLNEEFRREYIKRLGHLVDQHNLILNNTLRLRDLLSAPMLAQLTVSTTLICSVGFQVATTVNVNMTKWLMSLFYLGYNMFVQYVVCRWCEEIKLQSEGIADAVYCSGWENGIMMVPGVRTSILLILARAHKRIGLSAGGMYDLSLEAYANMVKTSYTALTVLLRLR